MNKKAQVEGFNGLIWVVVFMALIIIVSLFVAIGTGVLTFVSGEVTDTMTSLGMVDTSNMSEYSEWTFGNLDRTIQMLKWGSGIAIIFSILGVLIMASVIKMNPHGFLIGFYVLLMLVLVIVGIFVSNIYEEFRDGGDEIAAELRTMPLTSFLIIYYPQLIAVIGFIGGIIIFSGVGEEFM